MDNRILQKGMIGEDVKVIQRKLIKLGYGTVWYKGEVCNLEASGVYDEITEAAVESFQAKAVDTLKVLNIIKPVSNISSFINKIKGDENVVTGKLNGTTLWCIDYYYNTTENITILPKPKEEEEEKESEIGIEEKESEIGIEEEVITDEESIRQAVLETAISQIGTREHGGNNYGYQVQEYQEVGSGGKISGGAPWCQYFQNWCIIKTAEELGLEVKIIHSGYTPEWINWGKKKGITIIKPSPGDIEPGDLGYVYSSSRGNACHVYMIEEVQKSGLVKTIEGNTNPGGGSDGYGVFKRIRKNPWAIVKWSKLYS